MSGELPAVDGNEVIAALKRAGFEVARIRGSHHVLKKPGHRPVVTVPVHRGRSVKAGTLGQILRSAGIDREAFRELLSSRQNRREEVVKEENCVECGRPTERKAEHRGLGAAGPSRFFPLCPSCETKPRTAKGRKAMEDYFRGIPTPPAPTDSEE